ncbi:MAG: carbohydrate transporter substrate-binding protein [Herbinix sp.]|jgi:hypothetical protein|nr:carbohydrate transporter substrate-binding protein [Herbinix sp.]
MKQVFRLIMMISFMLLLTACKDKDAKPTAQELTNTPSVKEKAMELYSKNDMTLPLNVVEGKETVVELIRESEGKMVLYTAMTDETTGNISSYAKYLLKEDNNWVSSELTWGSDQTLITDNYIINRLIYAPDGTLYAALKSKDQKKISRVVAITSDHEVKELTVPNLNGFDRMGKYLEISDLCLNGESLMINTGYYILGYDTIGQKVIFTSKSGYYTGLLIGSEQLITMDYLANQLMLMNPLTGIIEDTISLPEWQVYDFQMQYVNENNIFLFYHNNQLGIVGREGLYEYQQDTGKWKEIINGSVDLIGKFAYQHVNFIHQSEDEYLLLSKDTSDQGHLVKYSLKEQEPADKEVFHISAFQDNRRMKEAVITFAMKHPELMVVYDIAAKEEEPATIEEYTAQTNEKLKQNKAADILICDRLPYKNYMEQGYFEAINDIIEPYMERGEIYSNIVECLKNDENIYLVPGEFRPYIYAGPEDLMSAGDTLKQISDYTILNGKTVFNQIDYRSLAGAVTKVYNNELLGEDGNPDRSKLINFLQQTKKVSSPQHIRNSEFYWSHQECYFHYARGKKSLLLTHISHSYELMLLCSALDVTGDSYRSAKTFEALNIVGVNKNSTKKELVREFIELLLSEPIQDYQVGEGIPLRMDGIEGWETVSYGLGAMSSGIRPEYIMNEHDLTKEDIDAFVESNKELSCISSFDPRLADALGDYMEFYIKGYINEETAADLILANVNGTEPNQEEEPDQEVLNNAKSILFIGNSLTSYGGIPGYFKQIANEMGKDIEVQTIITMGCTLNSHVSDIKNDEQKSALIKNADIVVLQDHTYFMENSVEAVRTLMKMCKEGSIVYYFLTEYDVVDHIDSERRLSLIEGLNFLPIGYIYNELIESTFGYPELHMTNDYHPNHLSGYIEAAAIYNSLFGEIPQTLNFKLIPSMEQGYIPGITEDEKRKTMDRIRDIIINYKD